MKWLAANSDKNFTDEALVAALTCSYSLKDFLMDFERLPAEYQAHITMYPSYHNVSISAVRMGIPIDTFKKYASHSRPLQDNNLLSAAETLNKLIAKNVDPEIIDYLIALAVAEKRRPRRGARRTRITSRSKS